MKITVSGTVMVRVENEGSDAGLVSHLTHKLKRSAKALADAMAAIGVTVHASHTPTGEPNMAAVSPELQALETQVAANTDVEASAAVLITGLHQKLIDAGTDPVKLKALADSLKTSGDSLAAAVAANTLP